MSFVLKNTLLINNLQLSTDDEKVNRHSYEPLSM